MVDNSGNPLILYHGTKANFDSFNDKKKGSATDEGIRGRGFYFNTNIKSSQSYGQNLLKVYLRVIKPIDLLSFKSLDELINFLEIDSSIIHERGRGTAYHSIKVYAPFSGIFTSAIIDKGFDGIIHGQEIVVFNSNQIKSIKNDGTWDVNDNNIYS